MLQPAHPSGLISAPELANYAPSNAVGSSGSSSPSIQQQHHPHLAVHHAHSALAMPMDLHLSQGYPFYAHRKGGLEDFVTSQGAGLHSGILEMRKEKSRDAARSRRGKENYEFYELAKMLPLPAAITSQLDKASIIRLTISYLKLKDFSSNGDPPWAKENPSKALKGGSRNRTSAGLNSSTLELFDQHQGTHILQSLDGFAFSLGSDGRFLYISETVSIYLGLSQVEMTGSSVFDYVHTADHSELAEQLGLTLASSGQPAQGSSSGQGMNHHHLHSPPSPASATGSVDDGNSSMNPDVTSLMSLESNAAYKGLDRCFCIRMKSTLTKRGCHFKSSGYRVVMVLCRLRPQSQFSASKSNPQQQQLQPSGSQPLLGMIALAIALPPPTVHEVRLEPDMFVTRLSFDFRIVHCEPRISDLLDFVAEDLTGRSLYTLCHAEDIRLLRKAHTDLMHKGQVMTPYYRVMNRHGGFTWLQSCATVVCNSKNGDEQSIVCVNYVLSRTEMGNLILDQCQLESAPPMPIKTSGFKTDLSSQREFPVSPEGASSESDQRSANQGGTSDSSALDNRPSPELEVEESVGAPASQLAPPPPPEESGSGLRSSRHSRNSNRSGKRKYQETVSASASTELNGMVAMEDVGTSSNSNGVSGETTNAADDTSIGHGDDAEADAARWKRLYSGSGLDHETLQDRDMDGSSLGGSTTDFSTDALLSKPRSTIQWIGTPTSSSSAAAALSASSLMHQIFASRESVIRANVHANRTPGGLFNGAGGDNLPTPPGSGGPGDYASAVHDSVFTSSYSASTGFRPEYLPAMTPPSSVSPRDATEPSLRYPYTLADSSYVSPAQPLPLKPPPHVYGVHGIDHSASAQYGAQSTLPLTDASQFYPHGASGFHLYHPQISKSAASNNSAASWYPN